MTRARDALAAERRRMPWMAVEKAYAFDGPGGKASLRRPVRRPPSADRLPRLLRARRARLARPRLPRLLDGGRPGRPPRPSQRPRHDARVRLARAAGRHRPAEGADGLGTIPWYTITDSFDADFGVDEWHGTNAFIRDGDKIFRTYFINSRGDEQMGGTWNYLDITPLGRQEEWEDSPEGYPQTPTVQMVELARQLRPRRRARQEVGRGVGRRRGRHAETG